MMMPLASWVEERVCPICTMAGDFVHTAGGVSQQLNEQMTLWENLKPGRPED